MMTLPRQARDKHNMINTFSSDRSNDSLYNILRRLIDIMGFVSYAHRSPKGSVPSKLSSTSCEKTSMFERFVPKTMAI
jgi:hypothetical protein